jgi:hypothetical protein
MIRLSWAFVLAGLLLLTACESTRKVKEDIREDVTMRTIERARLHSAKELKEAYDQSAGDADEALLLFFNALLLIEENKNEGYAAGAYMSRSNDQWSDPEGPTGVKPSKAAEYGYSRMHDNPHYARSYTGGKPSDYKLADPEKVVLKITETRENSSTETKFFVSSSGKDSASPITLRLADGKWYVDEWSSMQTGVRK